MSNSLQPHGLQHIRLPCPLPTPGACSNMSIESVMPSNHLILCCPLLLPPSIFPRIRVFSNESVHHIRWPKYWSFGFNISSSSGYSGLISLEEEIKTDFLLEEVTINPTIEPPSRQPTNCRTIIPRNYCTVKKVLGPTTDFPTWRSGKGIENAQRIWLWKPVGFDHRTSTGLGK